MKKPAGLTDNMWGILLLFASVTCFGVVDGISKMLIETQSFGQVMLARYVLALPILLLATAPGEWKNLFHTRLVFLQIVRGIVPVVIGGSMVIAVWYLPLAEATVILFAGPFLVLALSGWLLGEKVGAASWVGVVVGFIAVLIVARPGFSELSQYTIFPADCRGVLCGISIADAPPRHGGRTSDDDACLDFAGRNRRRAAAGACELDAANAGEHGF